MLALILCAFPLSPLPSFANGSPDDSNSSNNTDTKTNAGDPPPNNQQLVDGAAGAMNNAVESSAAGAAANAKAVDEESDANGQEAAQDTAKKNKSNGSKMSTMLGIGLLAAGGIMLATGQMKIASGTATMKSNAGNPPMLKQGEQEIATGGTLTKMGLFTMAGGGAALLAGQMMAQDAGANSNFKNDLGNLGDFDPNDTFNVGDGTPGSVNDPNGGSGIRGGGKSGNSSNPAIDINPEDLRNGTLGEILDKFEADTGLSRDDFARGVQAGISPAELLQGQGGLTKKELEAGIAAAEAASDFGGASGLGGSMFEAAQEAGLGDLAKELQANLDGSGDSTVDYDAGSGRGLATGGKPAPKKFDFNSLKSSKPVKKVYDPTKVDFADLSEQVRNQLIKEGRSGKSLFDMVSHQYRKKTPLLFGRDPDQILEGKFNPDRFDDEDVFNEI